MNNTPLKIVTNILGKNKTQFKQRALKHYEKQHFRNWWNNSSYNKRLERIEESEIVHIWPKQFIKTQAKNNFEDIPYSDFKTDLEYYLEPF